ncbi:hypothetical protein HDU81_000288 [Chytriomyces hyalinus]|nr:hypothetical protein HDU81_000288 [Chytriomyces hyalinus]
MHDLPFEVLRQIFLQLDPFKIAKYRRVCRSFNSVLTAHPFSNLLGVVRIGQIYEHHVACFVTPASFGEAFFTKTQKHVEDSSGGAFKMYPINSLKVLPINVHKTINDNSLFENLPQHMLSGPISPALGNMTNRTSLIMVGNYLTGPLPSELGNLINLKKLNLSRMSLDGGIPDSFGNLVNLEELDLSEDGLTGSIPASFGNLIKLVRLRLDWNKLSGTVPEVFGRMTKLQMLSLSHNHLEGLIPQSISKCAQLRTLWCDRNRFSGPIPESVFRLPLLESVNEESNSIISGSPTCNASAEFAASLDLKSLNNFSSNQLEGGRTSLVLSELNLSNNQLSGRLPNSITLLTDLERLYLQENKFSGPLPTEIGGLLNLRILHLGGNQISGVIPDSISSLVALEALDLCRNSFVGTIPTSIASLVNLTLLLVENNELSGPLPTEIGLLASLATLKLSHNRFCGGIPESIQNLMQLRTLDISHNELSGEIPPGIFLLSSLILLQLNNNSLSGPLHPDNGALIRLVAMDLSHNQLTGSVPENVLPRRLSTLKLNHNRLSGALPNLNVLTSIKTLRLDHNQFSGHLPMETHGRKTLKTLNFSHNQLSGPILPSILSNVSIECLDLSNNSFNGTLSSALFGDMRQLRSLNLSNNQFSGLVPESLGSCSGLELLDLSDAESASCLSLDGACETSFDTLSSLPIKDLNPPSKPALVEHPQLPLEIWLYVLMFVRDPSQLVMMNKSMAMAVFSVYAVDGLSKSAITIQAQYIISRFGLKYALPSLPKWSFFTKGPSSLSPIQPLSDRPVRGECQFCQPYYKLKEQLRMKEQKRWFKTLRRRIWLPAWKYIEWMKGLCAWLWISIVSVILCRPRRGRGGSRQVDLHHIKQSEISSMQALSEVVSVVMVESSKLTGESKRTYNNVRRSKVGHVRKSAQAAADRMSQEIALRDINYASSPCRLERHQIILLHCIIRLGAVEDLGPIIEYAAIISHLNLLGTIVQYTEPQRRPVFASNSDDPISHPPGSNSHISQPDNPMSPPDSRPEEPSPFLLNGRVLAECTRRQNHRLMRHLCERHNAAKPINRGFTSVEIAAEMRDTTSLRILIDNGAKACVENSNDETVDDDQLETARVLIALLRAATIRRVFGIPLREGGRTQRVIEALILAQYRPQNQVSFLEFADTFLVPMLVEVGSVGLLRAAWDCGVDLDINDSMPLYFSLISGHWRVVRFLTHEVAVIQIRDLEAERRRLKQTWRIRMHVTDKQSDLERRERKKSTYTDMRRSNVRVVPDLANANSVTFVPEYGADQDPARNPSVDTIKEHVGDRFYKTEPGVIRRRAIRVQSVFRTRRLIGIVIIIVLHAILVCWFLYTLTMMGISVYCYYSNRAHTVRQYHQPGQSYSFQRRSSTDEFSQYRYYWSNHTYPQPTSYPSPSPSPSSFATPTNKPSSRSNSATTSTNSNNNDNYEDAVYITGWCALQCDTSVLDSNYWSKNGAVLFMLSFATFLAERTMPLYGILISCFEVASWMLKQRLLLKIVEMKRKLHGIP